MTCTLTEINCNGSQIFIMCVVGVWRHMPPNTDHTQHDKYLWSNFQLIMCFINLTASQRRRIEAAEMKLLRPLAGYTLCDHQTNNSIRKELRITSILDKIDEYRKKWLLRIQRMPQTRIPLKSYNYRPQGRRSIGRPKKRWREQL